MLYHILRLTAILLCKFLFGIKISGRGNIPQEGGFILASNHRSNLDPVVLGVACPRKLNFMAKEELFRNPFFGWFISQLGAFPVKRNHADISAVRQALKRVNSGKALVVFPEGSRNYATTASEVQAGIGFLAAKINAPVIPVFISGTEEALPRGAKSIRRTKVCVYFGRQISVERRTSYQEIAQQIMNNIIELSPS